MGADAAMGWQDWLLVVGAIVSAVAAVGALYFAWRTVGEGRALREEERLARMAELVADLGRMAIEIGSGDYRYAIERRRLGTMLTLFEDSLPNCRMLAFDAKFADPP